MTSPHDCIPSQRWGAIYLQGSFIVSMVAGSQKSQRTTATSKDQKCRAFGRNERKLLSCFRHELHHPCEAHIGIPQNFIFTISGLISSTRPSFSKFTISLDISITVSSQLLQVLPNTASLLEISVLIKLGGISVFVSPTGTRFFSSGNFSRTKLAALSPKSKLLE
jgi:hypothetical protein